ncbi:hypothetical protein ALC60_02268 [Trachymyrmex zeteki]|uniref:Uncharacterized protein n=1 Tax=Mycetomoellerius zeteki TaxID=64791 RepID=A0A151XE35_9HYME|nr:hypothetical protein ALC60_02268 [Trachymyrmex zeteki]
MRLPVRLGSKVREVSAWSVAPRDSAPSPSVGGIVAFHDRRSQASDNDRSLEVGNERTTSECGDRGAVQRPSIDPANRVDIDSYKILKRLTITTHADSDALFETAILTAISVDSEDAALLILGARTILNLLLDAPTKEALRITNKTLVNLTVTVRRRPR